MKIAYISDLHLEFDHFELKNEEAADVLVLAGDVFVARESIGREYHKQYFAALSEEFPRVVYVMGNHEHYGSCFHQTEGLIRDLIAPFDNIHLLEKSSVEIDGVLFVGSTLWTNMNEGNPITQLHMQSCMSDYQAIKYKNDVGVYRRLTPQDTVQAHNRSLQYIADQVDEARDGQKVVVITHHAPSERSVHEQYKHDYHMNGAFRTDLDEFISLRPEVVLWFHGHMHNVFDYWIKDTRILCNPRGYQKYGDNSDAKLRYVEL